MHTVVLLLEPPHLDITTNSALCSHGRESRSVVSTSSPSYIQRSCLEYRCGSLGQLTGVARGHGPVISDRDHADTGHSLPRAVRDQHGGRLRVSLYTVRADDRERSKVSAAVLLCWYSIWSLVCTGLPSFWSRRLGGSMQMGRDSPLSVVCFG